MALKPVTVTQLNEYISRVLMTDPLLGNISVTGEISNLKYHSSGHVYFSINDASSKVNCFFPADYVKKLNYQLGDGLEVIINGYINVYKKGGTYTLFVRSVQVAGEGNLAMAFQLLKDKLDKEGLFDPKYKKPLPGFPRKIGIITSETGAALQDILKIVTGRNNLVDIAILPVQVQGEGAAQDIARAIEKMNTVPELKDAELIIVGRGGGSSEDLWAFNEEVVARAIFSSDIPVISAVGHEIDFTISDFVADRRAETPTAAAEMAVPDLGELSMKLENLRKNLLTQLDSKVKYYQLASSRMADEMQLAMERKLFICETKLEKTRLILEENNPLSILSKGYVILENSDRNLISSVSDFNEGNYRLVFKDGQAVFTAADIKKN